jgi:NADH:ubiquinone oxidoreductase subunit E
MTKVNVSICTGSACYTAGATYFKQLNNIMGAKLKSQVRLSGSDCPGRCAECGQKNAPCVRIGDSVMRTATPGDLIESIRESLHAPALVA